MDASVDGGCTCGRVRYRMAGEPLIVHCCHCRWCQRETGSAFAINACIEAERVSVSSGEPEVVETPTLSGYGQRIVRCPQCRVALWSNYAGSGPAIRFVRVGTLDDPDRFPPQVHIFAASRQRWVTIPPDAMQFAEFYEPDEVWPAASLERRRAILPQIEAWRAARTKMRR